MFYFILAVKYKYLYLYNQRHEVLKFEWSFYVHIHSYILYILVWGFCDVGSNFCWKRRWKSKSLIEM